MKHIKFFENNNTEYWVVSDHVAHLYSEPVNIILFPDEKSAENYVIDLINYRLELMDQVHPPVVDINKAIKYYAEVESEDNIAYYKVTLQDKYELPERLKILQQTTKYNI